MSVKGEQVMNTRLEEKPTSLGTYSIPSAALYVMATLNTGHVMRLTTRHLHHWTRAGLAGGYLTGIRNRNLFINFKDLISLRAIAVMRANGMNHTDILTAERVLKQRYHYDYPFATIQFWTAPPRDIFVKEDGVLLSASRHLQSAMDFFEQYLQPSHNIMFDMFGVAASWKPRANVLFDPSIQYGEPCVEGTRIPTQVLYSFYKAGDTISSLAHFYDIQQSRIEDAIDWEKRIQEVASRKAA